MPPCSGKVLYNGSIYDAAIKAQKVVSCPELSRELRCDISKLPLQIIGYNFDLQNDAFRMGMAKIAFNYALAQGVKLKYLQPGLVVNKTNTTVNSIEYNYNILPFWPLNQLDACVELQQNNFALFHSMILFSNHNELWCYIDLFNTFQYYVLLSDTMPQNTQIHASYAQKLQKVVRTPITMDDLRRPKDIMIYAQQYHIKPHGTSAELLKQINNAIARQSQKVSLSQIYTPLINQIPIYAMHQMLSALYMYFNNDEFQDNTFRILTPLPDNMHMALYPHALSQQYQTQTEILRTYTNSKFDRLNAFLCNRTH